LNVRTQELDFTFGGGGTAENKGRHMYDLILKPAIWQDEDWVDRLALSKCGDLEDCQMVFNFQDESRVAHLGLQS
jgi:hypothetical protein